jgi:hypothetical protein
MRRRIENLANFNDREIIAFRFDGFGRQYRLSVALRPKTAMRSAKFTSGDWVIYRKLKHSALPGPRALEIAPSPNGELYSYFVDKFWIVQAVLPDGRLQLRTRRGKVHHVASSDPKLRRVSWWNRWFYSRRFQEIEAQRQ